MIQTYFKPKIGGKRKNIQPCSEKSYSYKNKVELTVMIYIKVFL